MAQIHQKKIYDLQTEQAECMRQLLDNQLFVDYVKEDYDWREVGFKIWSMVKM